VVVEIPAAIRDQIVEHARSGLPDETCGILAGQNGVATRFFPATNADASPYKYSIDSKDLLDIVTEIEDAGDEIVAIYHSHTRSPALPSRTDVELAFWPDAAYLIVSLMNEPDLRAWEIRDGRPRPAALTIT